MTLIIKRSPPSGVFGEVSVQFKVNEVAANGDIIDDSRNNDVIPKHGFVTIEDGVSETVRFSYLSPNECSVKWLW